MIYFLTGLLLCAKPFIIGELEGQLGNQFFIIAATVSLAIDHNATPVFPDLDKKKLYNIPLNRKQVFGHLNTQHPLAPSYTYREPYYQYAQIPYHPNMKICGYFQSEKYFVHHKEEILRLFAPSSEIIGYLLEKYAHILNHPRTVSIHIRFYHEDPEQKCHLAPRKEYYERAIGYFPDDSLFVVFSNQMDKCKQFLSGINKHFVFIEGESHYHDLYLMSLCKDNIITNSSFSWWGAYLNLNVAKRVIAPRDWYNPAYGLNTKDLIPDHWLIIDVK
jgi:hypothetical protein